MTEAQWLASSSPRPMLIFLQGRASNRKLRLFAVACCRWIVALLDDPRSVAAMEVAERYADGLATEEQRATAARSAQQASSRFLHRRTRPAPGDYPRQVACSAATAAVAKRSLLAAQRASMLALDTARLARMKERSKHQATLLREIFGNPFRPIIINSSFQTWRDGVLGRLAAGIYDERAFDRLPILADALEEAGCTDADILNHCRQPGEHVRGCWVVDLLLNKS